MSEYYPESFSFDEFKEIGSYAGKLQYAERNLQKLKSGSARTVYKIDDEKVLKVAKNKKGLEQNLEESDANKQKYDIVAKVFDVDEDDYWVEMELAKKVNAARFKSLTGIDINDFSQYVMFCRINSKDPNQYNKAIQNFEHTYDENEFLRELLEFIRDYDLPYLDWGELSTYGEVLRDGSPKIVVVDFGMTQEIWDTHYDKSKQIRKNQYR